MTDTPTNTFTDGPLGLIYLKTALPIIFVMGMNGLLSVADALFLGICAGPYTLAIPLTFLLPVRSGEFSIWYAGPIAEMMMLGLTAVVLWLAAQDTTLKRGMFHNKAGAAS